jgi:hypothetical protein
VWKVRQWEVGGSGRRVVLLCGLGMAPMGQGEDEDGSASEERKRAFGRRSRFVSPILKKMQPHIFMLDDRRCWRH